jgi:uncharacterized phage protein gp47/JayE
VSSNYPEPVYETPDIAAMNIIETGNEADLVQMMITYYQRKRPSWTPHPGNVEVMIFETLASVITGEIAAVRQVAFEVVRQLLAHEGIVYDEGAYASARVRFETQTSLQPVEIPRGTRLRVTLAASLGETADLVLEEPVTIYPEGGNNVGYGSAVATFVGSAANGIPAGTPLSMVDNVALVQSVTLFTPILGGRDPETDETFAARAEQARAAFNGTLGRPESFEAYALRDPAVGRAHVLDRFDPANPTATSTGHVAVVVTDAVGQPLTDQAMSALRSDIMENALASLNIHVLVPSYTTVDMAVTLRVHPGYDPDLVASTVTQALENWLSPVTWNWAKQITPYMIVGLVDPIPGVAEVITVPATITLPGSAPLPVAGVISVTAAQ